jgi:hypothetical protein
MNLYGLTDFAISQEITTLERSRGRPPRDQVESVRARIWYWEVRARSELTDYSLNRRFCTIETADGESVYVTRAFERIRRLGAAPISVGKRRDFDLVDRVDRDPLFTGTAEVFRAPFWVFLRIPDLDVPALQEFIKHMLSRLEMYRPNWLEAAPAVRETWFDPPSSEYAQSIKELVALGTLDSVTMVGALYREALQLLELELAIHLKTAFQHALDVYTEHLRLLSTAPHMTMYKDAIDQCAIELFDIGLNRILYHQRRKFSGLSLIEDIRSPILQLK